MNVSFGQIFKTNVYIDKKKVEDLKTIEQITNTLARDLSCSRAPQEYGDLTHQQRIMLRMFDASYKIPEEQKKKNEITSSTVSMVTIPDVGRYMIVGKSDNEAMKDIRHKTIGVEHYYNGRSMESAYLEEFKPEALRYVRSHSNGYEVNIQAKKTQKGDGYYISLIDFTKAK
jgi:hypothetical protein